MRRTSLTARAALGRKDNFPVDREAAEKAVAAMPVIPVLARVVYVDYDPVVVVHCPLTRGVSVRCRR
jgi:hypothetical protein